MTMVLCAASAMPLVSEAKDNAGAQLLAQAEATQGKAEDTLKRPAFEDKRIEINLASRLLTLYQGDVGIRMYPVAPGKPDSPTPTGRRKVVEMEINPTWVDPDDPKTEVPSGPDCPLGYRWIGIGGNYGIHGTNVPSSIGGYASHGCVRMYEKDVEDLFDHIVKGIPVDIKYERVVAEMDTYTLTAMGESRSRSLMSERSWRSWGRAVLPMMRASSRRSTARTDSLAMWQRSMTCISKESCSMSTPMARTDTCIFL